VAGPKQKQQNNVENKTSPTQTRNAEIETKLPDPILNWTGFILRNTHAEINTLVYEDGPAWIAEMWNIWIKNSDYGNQYTKTWKIAPNPSTTSSKRNRKRNGTENQ